MLRLENIAANELDEISKQIADAFYDYKYNDEDLGLIKYISDRQNMFVYMNAIVKAAYNSKMLYTTSEDKEGYKLFVFP